MDSSYNCAQCYPTMEFAMASGGFKTLNRIANLTPLCISESRRYKHGSVMIEDK